MNKNTIYQFEVGVLLNKDNNEYEFYSNGWDKNNGYYDENFGFVKTYEEAINYVEKYIKDGVKNTYGIISKVQVNEEDLRSIHNGYSESINMDYDLEKIIYNSYKNDEGILIENFINKNINIYNLEDEESEVL